MNIAITGSTGFVGKSLIEHLSLCREHCITEISRHSLQGCHQERVENTYLKRSLQGIDVLIHLAAKAHGTHKVSWDSLKKSNIDITRNLATIAAESGVKKFIFISSSYVHGSTSAQIITETTPINPTNNYARSKAIAEKEIIKVSKESNMTYVIIRPAPIYRDNAPGNLRTLMNAIKKSPLLIVPCADKRKTLVAMENLISFINFSITSDSVKNKDFLVSDLESLTIQEIIQNIAKGMNRKPLILSIPEWATKLVMKASGNRESYEATLSEMIIYPRKATSTGWKPEHDAKSGLQKCGEYYLKRSTWLKE